ncbi:MAG TPA: multidrug efflux SMR transporter [Beijerinckiaceae bacterium]
MAWANLALAIIAEVAATTALKASDGFTRPVPSLVTALGYALAFYCLSLTLRSIPVAVAYAVWSGAGLALITLIGWIVYRQALDAAALVGMGLIVAGIVVLNLSEAAGR